MIKNLTLVLCGLVMGIFITYTLLYSKTNDKIRKVILSQDEIIKKENHVVKSQQFIILKQIDAGNYDKIKEWLVAQLNSHVRNGSQNQDSLINEIRIYLDQRSK